MENNQPTNPSGSSMLIKFFVGLIIWWIMSIMVFLAFVWLGSSIDAVLKTSSQGTPFTPLIWLSFMWISLITSIIGSIIVSLIYNVLRQDDYYDMKIMSSWILSSNLLTLLIFLFFYIYVGSVLHSIDSLFLVYGFHLFFSIFISFVIMDILKNPNYSPVYVIWNSFWFVIALLIFFIIYTTYSGKWWEAKNILFFPPILSFSIIPLMATIWEKLYYKFYEMWNDFLYVPSLSEVLVDEEEIDEINVDI